MLQKKPGLNKCIKVQSHSRVVLEQSRHLGQKIHFFNLPDLLPRLLALFKTKRLTSSVQNDILGMLNYFFTFLFPKFLLANLEAKLINLSFPCRPSGGSADAERGALLGCLLSGLSRDQPTKSMHFRGY